MYCLIGGPINSVRLLRCVALLPIYITGLLFLALFSSLPAHHTSAIVQRTVLSLSSSPSARLYIYDSNCANTSNHKVSFDELLVMIGRFTGIQFLKPNNQCYSCLERVDLKYEFTLTFREVFQTESERCHACGSIRGKYSLHEFRPRHFYVSCKRGKTFWQSFTGRIREKLEKSRLAHNRPEFQPGQRV